VAIGFFVNLLLPVLDLTDFKRDLSELTDRLGHAQDCL
jgi:peptide chain release factor 2